MVKAQVVRIMAPASGFTRGSRKQSSGSNSHRLPSSIRMPKLMLGARRWNISRRVGEKRAWKGLCRSVLQMNLASCTSAVLGPGALAWPPAALAVNFTSA